MNRTYSVTFGLYNGGHVTFWSDHTQVRLVPMEAWHPLDDYKFEDYVGETARFQFKTTAVYERDDENDKKPWERTYEDEEDDIKERPCTWTLSMERVLWVRTIYLIEGENNAT